MTKLQCLGLVSFWVASPLLGGCQSEAPTGSGIDVILATQGGDFSKTLDAIPTTDGERLYFVGDSATGPGVFSVASAGGSAEKVQVGPPFVLPMGLTLASDDATIFVADRDSSATDGAGAGEGAIFALLPGAPDAAPVAGTEGTRPTALDLVAEGGVDQLYFTGIDPTDEQPALFKVPAAGGERQVVVKGSGLVSPEGVAVRGDGDIFISDREAGDESGRVFRFHEGALQAVVEELVTGEPAGIALTLDGATLLISSIDANAGTDQVMLLTVSDNSTSLFTDVIGQNRAGGGVHRAHGADYFAWADYSGKVYNIRLGGE